MPSGSAILAGNARRILIAGVSTRALARSAKAAGYDVLSLDYFGDYDQKSWCENYSLKRDFNLPFGPARLYEASRTLAFDALVYTASLENHPAIVARWAGNGAGPRLLGNNAAVLARVRHWPSLAAFLQRQGLSDPRTYLAGQRPAQGAAGRWLRKPVHSGGGHDVTFWPADRPVGRGFLLQEYVPGRVCSAAFLANGQDAALLGLTEQLIGRAEFGASGFTYCGNIFPLPQGEDGTAASLAAQARQLVADLAREFRLVGLNGLDFVFSDGRIWPLEINPRYSASMELIELATGFSMFDWQVRSTLQAELPAGIPNAQGRPVTLSYPMPRAACAPASNCGGVMLSGPATQSALPAGTSEASFATQFLRSGPATPGSLRQAFSEESLAKAILYAERDCRAPDTRGWPERGLCDVPFPGEEIRQGEPVCTIIARGPEAGACYASLTRLAEELKGELYA